MEHSNKEEITHIHTVGLNRGLNGSKTWLKHRTNEGFT